MADPGISNPHGAGRHAPRRGPAVSRLAFGGAPIGNLYAGVDETIARLAVERAWQHGIRHFDTAPYYGYGLAEQRLGAALAGVPRASYTLSTKVGRLIEDAPGRDALADGFDVAGKRAVFDYSRDGVRRAVDASRVGSVDSRTYEVGRLNRHGPRRYSFIRNRSRAKRARRPSDARIFLPAERGRGL